MHRVELPYPAEEFTKDCERVNAMSLTLPSGVVLLGIMLDQQEWLQRWFIRQYTAWLSLHCDACDPVEGCWDTLAGYQLAAPNHSFVLLNAQEETVEVAFTDTSVAMLFKLTFT